MNSVGRHPNIVIGLLLAAVAVLVIVAVVALGTPAAPVPNAAIGVATPVPAVTATPTPAPVVSAPESPSTTEIAPGVLADCGRIGPAACEQAIALARVGNEADLVGTTLVVVDDICAPQVMCDRMFAFDSIVVFVTAGGDTTGWYAFHVVGLDDVPTQAERWQDEVPHHIVERIRAALATP